MKAKRFLALQSIFYAFANGIEALVPFLLAPILTRTLEPAEYGIWVLFITYSTFLRPIIGLTSQDAIRMRFYDFSKQELDRFTHTVLYIMMVIMCVGTIIVFMFLEPLAGIAKFPAAWLVTIVITAFLFEVFYTMLALHQFHQKKSAFMYTQIAQALLSMAFISLFLYFGWDWRGVILGRMLGMTGAILISLKMLGYGPKFFFKMPPRKYYRNIASFGVVYWPSGMVLMAMAMIDKVVAAHYIGVEASALYGVAALFASAFWVVNQSFVLAWTPWLFRKLGNVPETGFREVISVSMAYFVTASLAAGVIYLMSVTVAPVLLGERFHSAIPLVAYIMIAILMQGFFFHNMKFLHYEKSIRIMSLISALALALNLWLSVLWAREGLEGIIFATIVSFAVTFLLSGLIVVFQFASRNDRVVAD